MSFGDFLSSFHGSGLGTYHWRLYCRTFLPCPLIDAGSLCRIFILHFKVLSLVSPYFWRVVFRQIRLDKAPHGSYFTTFWVLTGNLMLILLTFLPLKMSAWAKALCPLPQSFSRPPKWKSMAFFFENTSFRLSLRIESLKLRIEIQCSQVPRPKSRHFFRRK